MKAHEVARLIELAMSGDKAGFIGVVKMIAANETAAGRRDVAQRLQWALETKMQMKEMRWRAPDELTKHATVLDCPAEVPALFLEPLTETAIAAVLDEHRYASELREAGLRPAQRILLSGPPGTGKTSTAMFLAHKLGKEIALAPAHKIVRSHLGESGAALASLFSSLPGFGGLLFLDEIDGLGIGRSSDGSAAHENARITNALLTLLEGDIGTSIVVAATNRRDLLDDALLRRFDIIVEFFSPKPDTARRILLDMGRDLPSDCVQKLMQDAMMNGWSHAALVNELMRARKKRVLDLARLKRGAA